MKLRFTPRAVRNLTAIGDYLTEQNPAAAARVRADIYDGLRDLLLFPQLGRPQRSEGVRKLVTRRYAYLVYYIVDQDEVIALSIRHPARRREHQDT